MSDTPGTDLTTSTPSDARNDVAAALDAARRAAEQAARIAAEPDLGTALVPTGAGSAEDVKAQMATGLSRATQARRQALELQRQAREAVRRQQAELEARLRAMDAQLAPLQEQIGLLTEGVATMNLYLGRDEEIITLRTGQPADPGAPLHVRQQVLAMDEESAIGAEHGGIDARDIAAFDEWLLADPANVQQVIPEERSVVAMMARRKDRDYGDP